MPIFAGLSLENPQTRGTSASEPFQEGLAFPSRVWSHGSSNYGDPLSQKKVRHPNYHYFSKSIAKHLRFVLQYASNLYCSAFSVPLSSREREIPQYSSHLYRSTPPICIAIRLPFVSQCFWENLGGCGQRDVPHYHVTRNVYITVFSFPGINFALHYILFTVISFG